MPDTPEQRAKQIAEEFFTDIDWNLALRTGAWVQVNAFDGREFLDTIASVIRETDASAVEREREECAKVADSMIGASRREIAAAIRARGGKQDD